MYKYEMRVLDNKLTLHHFFVSSTSDRRTWVINWEGVCIVLWCCVQYVEIYTEYRALTDSINVCFHLKKKLMLNHTDYLEAYGEHTLSEDTWERWFRRSRDGDFDVSDKERGNKKYEDMKLQALLYEDSAHIQKQLFNQLGVRQQVVSNRLREIRNIQKTGRWVSHKLNDRQMVYIVIAFWYYLWRGGRDN